MPERIQKLLAHAGVSSRRAAEELIVAGRVRVNGRIVKELGATASRRDKIEVDGRRIVLQAPVYFLFHKPRMVVTTMSDPEGRPSLGEYFKNAGARVYPVGRLDFHTSGALLVTNDGELADALLHPSKKVPKVYIAKLANKIHERDLQALRTGVVLDDGDKTAPADVVVIGEDANTWLRITLYEGKNRQIHRMGEAIGHRVMRLSRIEFAGMPTDGLRPGQYRELDAQELERLKKDYLIPSRNRKRNLKKAALREGGVNDGAEFFEGESFDGDAFDEAPSKSAGKSADKPVNKRAGSLVEKLAQRVPRGTKIASKGESKFERKRESGGERKFGGSRENKSHAPSGKHAERRPAPRSKRSR